MDKKYSGVLVCATAVAAASAKSDQAFTGSEFPVTGCFAVSTTVMPLSPRQVFADGLKIALTRTGEVYDGLVPMEGADPWDPTAGREVLVKA